MSKEDHEAQRLSLQAEINTLTAQLADLARKHEKTCTEVCIYVVLDVVYDSFHSTYLKIEPNFILKKSPCAGVPGAAGRFI